MNGALSRRRLEWLLRARGTDMAGWPADDRAAALELLRRSPEAQTVFAEALARDDMPETDGAVFSRMQAAFRRRLAPVSAAWRGVGLGVLAACMAAGLYLASAETVDLDAAGDLFNTAQTINLAALD